MSRQETLTPAPSKQVLYRMLEMSKNSGVTFVMVTHEPELAECADRIVTILDGKGLLQRRAGRGDEEEKPRRPFADLEGESGCWRGGSEGTESNKPSPLGKVPEAPT